MSQVKYAFRQLVLRPGMSIVVIVMLALGIGATTAIFSVFHGLLIEPLAVPEPGRLVALSVPGPRPGGGRPGLAVSDPRATFSYPMFRDLEARQDVLTGLAGHADFIANLRHGGEASGGRGMLVSGQYFDTLGIEPAAGRLIGSQDAPRVGESPVVVLSHAYWQSRFGGDAGVVGDTLIVNDQRLTIVGVAPEGFTGAMQGWRPHVFVPITLRWLMLPEEPRRAGDRFNHWVYLMGRLKPGVTSEQASASLNALHRGIRSEVEASRVPAEQRQSFLEQTLVLEPGARGQSSIDDRTQLPLTLLLGVTVLVLLIACFNIANVLLARGAARAGEMAVRASVGASRLRLVSQLLGESLVLAAIGGVLSVPIAFAIVGFLDGTIPQQYAERISFALSPTAVAYAAGVTLATVLLFAVVPALQAASADPGRVIKEGGARSSGGRAATRFRTSLITAQIAFSMVLLVLAGLFVQSLVNVARVDLGMEVDSVVSFGVSPRLAGYEPERLDALYERIDEALSAEAGVTGVASAAAPLMQGFGFGTGVSVAGREAAAADDYRFAQSNPMISADFFETLSIPLLAGRTFTEEDGADGRGVAIVNERFVREFDLGGEALGTRLRLNSPYIPESVEIVGIVGDAKYSGVKGEVRPQIFTPRPPSDESFSSLFFYVRAGIDPAALQRAIPRIVAEVDPNLGVGNGTTMRTYVRDSVYIDRLMTMLSAAFAGLATVLAAVGLYGVLAHGIAQRTREIGLRQALGATPPRLRGMVFRQVGSIALVGAAIGLVLALGAGRAAGAMLYGLSGYDPLVLGASASVLAVVVLAAAYGPARRAASIAPMQALRYE